MVLLCAAIRRDPVSLLRFPFLSYVQVFSYEISCLSLKMSIELLFFPFLFSGHFCSVDTYAACIVSAGCNQSSSMIFYVVFNASMLSRILASPLPLFFLSTHSQSTSSLGCKVLYLIIMRFLDLWSICWSSFLVYFKNDPEYLTRETAQVFIPLRRLLLCSLVSNSFLVLLRYSLFSFFMVSTSNIPKYL